VVRRCVWSRNIKKEETMTRVGKKKKKKKETNKKDIAVVLAFLLMSIAVLNC
jgi:hypothetical protein